MYPHFNKTFDYASERPPVSAHRSTDLIELPVQCHRLLLGIGTIKPGGWAVPPAPPRPRPAAASDQTPLCHKTRGGYAIFLAAFYDQFQFFVSE